MRTTDEWHVFHEWRQAIQEISESIRVKMKENHGGGNRPFLGVKYVGRYRGVSTWEVPKKNGSGKREKNVDFWLCFEPHMLWLKFSLLVVFETTSVLGCEN